MACWSTKAAISLKQVKIYEKLQWRADRNLPTLFRTYNPRPLRPIPSPRLGVCNSNPKLPSLLSQERIKLRTSNLAGIFTQSIRTKRPLKIAEKITVGVVRDSQIFQGTHVLGASRGHLCDSSAFLFAFINESIQRS